MQVKAMAVVRKNGAGNLGHVGWAFQWDNASAICGSTENPLGTLHTSYYEKGAWDMRLALNAVTQEFRSERKLEGKVVPPYDTFKMINVAAPNPQAAWQTMLWCKQQDYWLTGIPRARNCLDDAYDILRAFGCQNLPPPQEKFTPNYWFDNIQSPEQSLYRERLETMNVDEPPQGLELPSGLEAAAPLWRQPGTKENLELLRSIAQP